MNRPGKIPGKDVSFADVVPMTAGVLDALSMSDVDESGTAFEAAVKELQENYLWSDVLLVWTRLISFELTGEQTFGHFRGGLSDTWVSLGSAVIDAAGGSPDHRDAELIRDGLIAIDENDNVRFRDVARRIQAMNEGALHGLTGQLAQALGLRLGQLRDS